MELLRAIFRFDASGWRPVGALLRGLGVALAMAIGARVGGGWGAGVLAGVGALYAGIASFGGVHQARLKRMIAATAAAALTTLLGCLVEPSLPATVVAVSLGTFALGLLAAAGADAAQVSLLATGTLIVFSGLPGANAQPLGNAALVLGGGLGQAAILMAFHPISPVSAERRAVEAVYAGLLRFAQGRVRGESGPLPDVGVHAEARDLLRTGLAYGHREELVKLWGELELADALRGNFAGLDRTRTGPEPWRALASWLEEAADEVGRGRALDRRLPPFPAAPETEGWLRRIRRAVEAEETGRFPTALPTPGSWLAALRNVATLRELALGHALRYALAIGVATFAYRTLRVDHGYWMSLSLAFSLRTDFASTVTRGLGRTFGTAAGVLVATGMVALGPSNAVLTGAMIAAAWATFAFQSASFVIYSAMLAFYVVASVVLSGASVATVGLERFGATLVGAAFALAVALVWPHWEASKARTALAVAFAAQAEYADAAMDEPDPDKLGAARFRARAARLEAERVVAAAAFEPGWSRRGHMEGAAPALARLAENAARILAAHLAALDPHPDERPEDLRKLAEEDRSLAADLMG